VAPAAVCAVSPCGFASESETVLHVLCRTHSTEPQSFSSVDGLACCGEHSQDQTSRVVLFPCSREHRPEYRRLQLAQHQAPAGHHQLTGYLWYLGQSSGLWRHQFTTSMSWQAVATIPLRVFAQWGLKLLKDGSCQHHAPGAVYSASMEALCQPAINFQAGVHTTLATCHLKGGPDIRLSGG
jgi:hypothetical protein